jgi:Rrf2 family protein
MPELVTKTSQLAIQALIQIGIRDNGELVTPGELAAALGCSQTYLAKTLTLLTRAGYLRSQRGAQGGVQLAVPPESITLLSIMQTVQGIVLPSYCQPCELSKEKDVCAFHLAMSELHDAATEVLKKWTLKDLIARRLPTGKLKSWSNCRMRTKHEIELKVK